MLVSLGLLDGPPPDKVDHRYREASRRFAASIGVGRSDSRSSAADDVVFLREWVVWLPSDEVVVDEVFLVPGTPAAAEGAQIIATVGRLLPHVQDIEGQPFESPYPELVDLVFEGPSGVRLDVTATGRIDSSELPFEKMLGLGAEVRGVVRATSTRPVLIVPTSAVIVVPTGEYCVVAVGEDGSLQPVEVEPVETRSGGTFVISTTPRSMTRVLADPDARDAASC